MPPSPEATVLAVNCGSSSLRLSLYCVGEAERLVATAQVDRIGQAAGGLRLSANGRPAAVRELGRVAGHTAALDLGLHALEEAANGAHFDAAGHRIVHGGAEHRAPERVTPALLTDLRRVAGFAPLHVPPALEVIEAIEARRPGLPGVACFDTGFHRTVPELARLYALPAEFTQVGVMRYGFHGLSFEYIVEQLQREGGHPRGAAEGGRDGRPPERAEGGRDGRPPETGEGERDGRRPEGAEGGRDGRPPETGEGGRLIIAHLGNGSSMAAVRDGRSIDTTMGMTPTGGLMMGTRCGDLDPGVIDYLMTHQGLTPAGLDSLINRRSGLLGVSGGTSDMRILLEREASDPAAARAVGLFCYQARKHLGALVAVLGGLDAVVFTGGIGEHAAEVRRRICEGFGYLGLGLDAAANSADAAVISSPGSRVTVRVMKTNEELMICRHTLRTLGR